MNASKIWKCKGRNKTKILPKRKIKKKIKMFKTKIQRIS